MIVLHHLLMAAMAGSAISAPNVSSDTLGVGQGMADPLLTAAMYLIPAGVAFGGLHKLLNHQETGGGFLVEMILKGGGAVLLIQMFKAMTGLQ